MEIHNMILKNRIVVHNDIWSDNQSLTTQLTTNIWSKYIV